MIHRQRSIPTRHTQGGYFLVATLFSILILGAAMMMVTRAQMRNANLIRDAAEGAQMAQVALGLQGIVAASQDNPALLPTGTKTGVNWLKGPSCGGPATNPVDGYISCAVSGGRFGPQMQTTFTRNATTNYIEARTTFMVPAMGGDAKAAIVTADRMALSALAGQATPNSGTFFTAFANTAANANAPASPTVNPGANAGRVLMIASNAPSNDVWLRTDGTNRMLANLNMGGMSIANARDGRFTGDVRVENRLQVDQGATVMGPLDARGGVVASEVALTSINHYATEGIYDARVFTGATSYSVAKPNCASAGNSPGIYVAIQSTGTPNNAGYKGDAMFGARADVVDMGSTWRITPVIQTSKFDLALSGSDLSLVKSITSTSAADMRLVVFTRCR